MADGKQDFGATEVPTDTKLDKVARRVLIDGPSAPSSPLEGMAWYNTTHGLVEVYDGTAWTRTAFGRRVGAKTHRTSQQTIANATDVIVTFNIPAGIDEDTEGAPGAGIYTSGGDFTVPSGLAGLWACTFHADFALQMDGGGYVKVFVNGNAELESPTPVNATTGAIAGIISLSAGDVVNFKVSSIIASTASNQMTGEAQFWRIGG